MSKTSRIKPGLDIPVISSLEQADNALARIAALRRDVALINLGLNEKIAALKDAAVTDAAPHNAEIDLLAHALHVFAVSKRADLFAKRKSIPLNFGVIGFRQATRLATFGKVTFKRVLEMLQERNLSQYIRVKKEIDKEALKGADPEFLKSLNCKLVSEDEFFCEPAEEDVVDSPALAASTSGAAA